MNREPKTTSALPSTIGWISCGILRGVVLEVGVLDDDDLAGGVPEPGAQRGALALVDLVEDDRQVGVARSHLAEDLAGAVGRAVVDDDDLLADRDGADPAEDLVDRLLLVVDRDDDREDQVVGNPDRSRASGRRLRPGSRSAIPAGRDRWRSRRSGDSDPHPDSGPRRRSTARSGAGAEGERNIHRVQILLAAARPGDRVEEAPSWKAQGLRRGRRWFGEVRLVQDKQRAQGGEAECGE